MARRHKQGNGADGEPSHDVGGEHGQPPLNAIDDDAPNNGEANRGNRSGREHVGESDRTIVDPEDLNDEGHAEDTVAECRHRLARPQKGEVSLTEGSEHAGPAGVSHSSWRTTRSVTLGILAQQARP